MPSALTVVVAVVSSASSYLLFETSRSVIICQWADIMKMKTKKEGTSGELTGSRCRRSRGCRPRVAGRRNLAVPL